MKEYRLAAWPQLQAPFDRIAYRRMLSDMSHRHVTLAQLSEASGIRRQEVRSFLEMLEARGLITQRDAASPDSLFGSLRPLGGWLRKALAAAYGGH
jgi:Sulfolobus plasmid regulatory protein